MKKATSLLKALLLTTASFTFCQTALANSGKIIFHTGFPISAYAGKYEKFDLANPNSETLILSNYIAGGLLGLMIDTKYPGWHYNKDYIDGSLFAQLLQENIDTNAYPGGVDINPPTEKKELLAPGQGGPYQLNDYSKRLPAVNVPGSLGLINYQVLQGSLGYTIQAQDSGSQTKQQGPDSLDSVYFGPIAAAYFHFNDLNRLDVINSQTYGPEYPAWNLCKQNLTTTSNFNQFDMILTAAYNAGTYSPILKTLTDLCAFPDQLKSYIGNLPNFSMNDTDYINAFQLPKQIGNVKLTSLPTYYKNTTFILYPRQVEYYIDQLDDNNAKLAPYGLQTNTSFTFSAQSLEDVFIKDMQTLAYVDQTGAYHFIASQQAQTAFSQAMQKDGIGLTTTFNFNSESDRQSFEKLITDALKQLETNLGFSFIQTTETNHQPSNQSKDQ